MKTSQKAAALLAVALAAALLIAGMGNEQPAAEAATAGTAAASTAVPSAPRATGPARGAATAPVAAPHPQPGGAGPSDAASPYYARQPFTVLAHEALISKSPRALEYAMLYMMRCMSMRPQQPQVDARIAEAYARWQAACGPMAQTLDRNLLYALSSAQREVSLSMTTPLKVAALASAAADADAELLIERALRIPAEEKTRWFAAAGFDVSALGVDPRKLLLLMDAALIVESCQRWACDQEFRAIHSCLFMEACGAQDVTAQLGPTPRLTAGNPGAALLWSQARTAARRGLAQLGRT